jgi:hypothetical protein
MILEATATLTGGICMQCKKQNERNSRNAAVKPRTAKDVEKDILDEGMRQAIQARVEKAIGSGCVVQYAAYQFDARKLPIDNLDEVAAVGSVQFVQKHDPFWGAGKDYQSATVHNPTWLDVASIANEMINITGDQQHCFLEGFTSVGRKGKISIFELDMGS